MVCPSTNSSATSLVSTEDLSSILVISASIPWITNPFSVISLSIEVFTASSIVLPLASFSVIVISSSLTSTSYWFSVSELTLIVDEIASQPPRAVFTNNWEPHCQETAGIDFAVRISLSPAFTFDTVPTTTLPLHDSSNVVLPSHNVVVVCALMHTAQTKAAIRVNNFFIMFKF